MESLANDMTQFALRPTDSGMLERMGLAASGYAEYGANSNTVKGEKSAWSKYWFPFTRRLNTPAWRTAEAQSNPQREGFLEMAFVIDTWQRMDPRSKNDAVAQIQSAINVLGHIRRMHSRKGYAMPPAALLQHVAKGMAKEMMINYGKHSMVPTRCEPFTADQNVRMLSLVHGTIINGREYNASAVYWRSWRLVDTFANQTGERKSGIIGHELGEYNRADVLYVIGEEPPNPDPSPDELALMGRHNEDRVLVKGGPSKADQNNKYFGAAPRVFKLNRTNRSSFAAAMVDYELAYPVRGAARYTAPLFVQDGKDKRWTASSIDRTLDGVMKACMSQAEREHKTFHSKRVWLGSAFKHLKYAEGEIQALVHWRSADSIRIYGRMDEIYQMNARERASTATFTVINANSLPQIDPVRYTAQGALLMPDLVNIVPRISAAA